MKTHSILPLLFLLFAFLFSCKNDSKKEFYVSPKEFSILDSIRELNNISVVYDENFFPKFKSDFKSSGNSTLVDSMQWPYYKILYYGKGEEWFKYPSKELLDNNPIWYRINSDFVKGKIQFSDFENFNSPDLKIVVDTTQIINNERMFMGQLKGDSYAVYIMNNSNLWYIANMGSRFPILMQAMNRNGEWQHIEYSISPMDAVIFYLLEPKSYFVTSARKYEGDFKTKFRLKFKQRGKFIYSNEFSGSMNLSQFAIPEMSKTNDMGKKNYSIFLE